MTGSQQQKLNGELLQTFPHIHLKQSTRGHCTCNVISNLDSHGLLSHAQHLFRKRRSTETQLILAIDDLARNLDTGEEMGSILLDFIKAFVKVPYNRVLMKLNHTGVRKNLHD